MNDILFCASSALALLTAMAWWSFCIAYHLFSRWWENPYGRNLMSAGLVVALLHTAFAYFVLTDNLSMWLVSVLLVWSAYAAVRRVQLMRRAQNTP